MDGPVWAALTRLSHPKGVEQTFQPGPLSNAEIADRLSALAQLMSVEKANPYKVRAYRRAAAVVRGLGESVDELVRSNEDLRIYSGIGDAMSAAIQEIVETGTLKSLEKLRSSVSPELASLTEHPRLDPQRVLRIYKKLKISSIESLTAALESGELEQIFGGMAQHVRLGLVETETILLYHAHPIAESIRNFLLKKAGAKRVEAVGEYRRLVETISRFDFLVQTADFDSLTETMKRYGGRTPLIEATATTATYTLSSGPLLCITLGSEKQWGLSMIRTTGSSAHLRKLVRVTGSIPSLERSLVFCDEGQFYKHFHMQVIPPELREGLDEVSRARRGTLPELVQGDDICGDLHVHTAGSDGRDSVREMVEAAQELGYEYIGITDHTPSLKIANGQSIENLREQIREIDTLNERLAGFRVFKSAEVDILADGTLDLPDEVLHELDYTVCSIHSRFAMNREKQTERVLRAMDNPYFTILGHATGRLLLKRPGYELDFERIIRHAKERGLFFELNCSPDRLDVSAENARLVRTAGIHIAISTDSHSTPEFRTIRYGIEQARRAGLEKTDVLNCQPLPAFIKLITR